MEDKWVGLALAITSTMAIGTSFVITKKGLNDAADKHGFEGDGFAYLKTPLWWAGITSLVVGEVANFAAYAFAPAILVTPLGALSVLIGAVLGSYFLGEELGILGKLGCAICLIGSVVIVLHAPPDKDISTVDEILQYAVQPAFLLYCIAAIAFSVVMIYRFAPLYGKKNPLVFISICSVVGSVSVMSVKAFGIALKLSLAGNNQFSHPSTYVFAIVTVVCILTQMNYFNKALSQFPTQIVNPLYYVTFTTATLCASFILFRGFNTTDAVNTISLLCGFLTIFTGVYLLNLSRKDPDGTQLLAPKHVGEEGIPTDPMAGLSTRRSMQARRSLDPHRRSTSLTSSFHGPHGSAESAGLMHHYDVEHSAFGLTDLVEEPAEPVSTQRQANAFPPIMSARGALTPSDILSPRRALSPELTATKGVTLVEEPETIPPAHRATISGRKMAGRPPMPQSSSSASLSHQLSSLALKDLPDPSSSAESRVLAQVIEWLREEKSKRRRRLPADEAEVDLAKLEHILSGIFHPSLIATPKLAPRSPYLGARRGSLAKALKRSSIPTPSSDTDYFGDEILVPNVEATLDNSKAMAYTGGAGELEASDKQARKDRRNWVKFKEDILTITHTLRLKGWRRIPIENASDLDVARLSGALTNAVYVVKPPKELPPQNPQDETAAVGSKRQPMQLLLRIYGPQVEHLINRDDELAILRRLARKKIGPRLLGTFTNGRFEEYLHARTLTAEDLRIPETSKQIAKRMRELHDGVELLEAEWEAGPAIFQNWDKWVDRCEKIITWLDKQVHDLRNRVPGTAPKDKYTKYGLICGVDWPVFRRVYDRYRTKMVKEAGGQVGIRNKLVFAHNDTQYGNLMRIVPSGESPLLQPSNQHKQLVVIDFEYAGPNTAGLEFANHFTEWCYNYHHPEKPWACNAHAYPTPEEQHRFVRSYVMHRPQINPAASATPRFEGREKTTISDFMLDARTPLGVSAQDYDVEEQAREKKQEEDIQLLIHETRLWRIANSAVWVAWGIVQAKVPELDEPSKTEIANGTGQTGEENVLHPLSDPLNEEERLQQQDSRHDRPENREQEEAHLEGDEDEHEDPFDYLAYAQDRAMFFWGDCLQMGLVKEEELPEDLRKRTSANPPSSPSPVQNHDDSSRSARKQRRRINRLPNLVDQRWPHPDRRVRRRLQNPPFNTSIPPSIGVLQATSNITMANPTGIATAALSIPRSAISSDDDDDRGFRSGGNRNNNNNNAFTTLPGTITTDLDDPTLTALPDMSTAPVQPVRLWTEAQLAHAQRTHQSDAMAAEIARLNAEIRRLEAAVLALESEPK
ncbi:hypothetical protein DV738_g5061, partial [Chaetothyriales sp. CBS 135597]